MDSYLPYAGVAIAAYLLGSIPFGIVIARIGGLGDLRAIGSGNIGATNVLRTGDKLAAAATLIADGGKGAAAVLLARYWGGDIYAIIAAVAVFLGHVFPVWLKFDGGKGVATFLGTMLALDWRVGAIACGAWLITAAVARISSLSALIAATTTPFALWGFGERDYAYAAVLLALLIFYTHRANIRRLIEGTEPRIGDKK